MKIRDLIKLMENPISDINVYGDLDSFGSFNSIDRKYMKQSILNGVYKEKLKRVPFDFYLYFINKEGLEEISKQADDNDQYVMGEVHWDTIPYIKEPIRKDIIRLPVLNDLKPDVMKYLKNSPQSIHLICGTNYTSGGGKIKMTPWIILHRLLHTYKVYEDFEISSWVGNSVNDDIIFWSADNKISWRDIFMFKSVQDEENDNDAEMFMEAAVEYLIRGTIRVNVPVVVKKCERLGIDSDQMLLKINAYLENYKQKVDGIVASMKGTTRYI